MRPAAYICSTVTSHIEIVEYDTTQGPLPKVVRKVNIMGGANLPPKTLVTPKGVLTPVSAEDLAFLMQSKEFARQLKAGFMTVINGKSEDDLEAAVAGMQAKDGSAPKVSKDFEKPPVQGIAA